MVRKSAWFLNLDSDDELARPAGYTPSRAVLARIESLVDRVRGLLLPGDILLPCDGLPPCDGAPPAPIEPRASASGPEPRASASGPRPSHERPLVQQYTPYSDFAGRAWCPTPRALRALRAAGVTVAEAPPLLVLRAVNHRGFSASLGQCLPGARYALTTREVSLALSGPSPTGQWLLKRPYGYAGRGRLKVEPGRAGDFDRAQAWIEASLRSGEGLQVEPFVERLGDFALHGHVSRSGAVVLGEPTRQECDETGAWLGSTRGAASDLTSGERAALFEQAHLAAAALHEARYFGPFGIDAFRYRGEGGASCWNARGEINARYSMGWRVGMGDRRPDVEGE